MLSNSWSWYVIVLAVLNIVFMVWLLMATNKDNGIDKTDTTGHKWDGIEELNNPLPRWWLGLFIITIIFAAARCKSKVNHLSYIICSTISTTV